MSTDKPGLTASLRGAVVSTLLTRVAVMPLGLIQGILLARLLGPAGLGQYSALLTDFNLVVTVLALGLPGALAILLGERPQRLRALLRLGVIVWAALVVVPALCGIAASLLLPTDAALWSRLLRKPAELRLIAIAVVLQSLRDLLNNLLSGTQQFQAQNWQALGLGLLQLGLIAALAFALGGGASTDGVGRLSPQSAAAIQVLSNALLCVLAGRTLFQVARQHQLWTRAAPPPEDADLRRRALGISLRNLLHIIPDLLLLRIDVYLLQTLLPGGHYQQKLGLYQAGVRVAELIFLLPGTLNSILFAKAAAREDLTRVTLLGAKTSLYLALAALLGMALVGRPALVLLYGARYDGSFLPCLLVLTGCCALCFSSPLAGTLAGDSAYPRSVIIAQVVALAVNVAANLVLIPRYDIVGAALASALAYTVSALIITGAFAARFRVSLGDLLRLESPLRLFHRDS